MKGEFKSINTLFIKFLFLLFISYVLFSYFHAIYLTFLMNISALILGELFDMTSISHLKSIKLAVNEASYIFINFDAEYRTSLYQIISKTALIFTLMILFIRDTKVLIKTLFLVISLHIVSVVFTMLDSMLLYSSLMPLFKEHMHLYIASPQTAILVMYVHKLFYIFVPYFFPMYLGAYLWVKSSHTLALSKEKKVFGTGLLLLYASSLNAAVPVMDTNTLTINEAQTLTLSSSNIAAHDDDGDPITFTVSSVANGSFSLTSFTPAQIDNNEVTFTHNGGEVAPSFDVLATANSEDSTLQNATINYTPINDAPVITANGFTVNEAAQIVLSNSEIAATDAENDAITFAVSSVNGGQFELTTNSGVAVTSFSAANIAASEVVFVHDGSEINAAFNLVAGDGADNSASSASVNTTTGVNDAPTISKKTLTITEAQTVTLTASNIAATDPDTQLSGNESATIIFTVSSISGGQFELSTNAGVAVTSFSAANIAAGKVSFVHNGSETDAAFSVIANDGVVDSSGGVLVATINFTEANDPLTGFVTITGPDPREGETMTADTTTNQISDLDAPISAFSYQWKADGVNVASATSATYLLASAEVGKRMTVLVSYTDSNNLVESTLSAQTAVVTGDLDGIATVVEDEAPTLSGSTLGDGNNDNRQDSLQANVSSGFLNSAVSGRHWFTVFSKNGTDDIKHTKVENSVVPASISSDIAMIAGLFTIEFNGITSGATANIEVYVPYHPDYNAYIKYNNSTGKWDNMSGVTVTHFKKDNKTRFQFSVVDGGVYDSDGAANGTILDPGGPAFVGMASAPISPKSYLFLLIVILGLGLYGERHYRYGN